MKIFKVRTPKIYSPAKYEIDVCDLNPSYKAAIHLAIEVEFVLVPNFVMYQK
ncbi:hypothetical protein N0B40_06180 [Chryseobacterium oranimense]|uniref:hypothetical protein n=1 Tax=Chryseobacterium oranimense TaxID=421058 RepID=UPI0021AED17F|nr:hypothetical protein [Chryseobacterium oranimense]UWX61869.1 hypothetical protein N0B40_06180 [Chryseobacterium oranimense]